MIEITKEHVLLVHSIMLKNTGGADGVRDFGLLDSALHSPFQTFGGKEIYPSLLAKAAAMCRSIVCNLPFVDGNKRTGIQVMLTFLELNGVIPNVTDEDLIDLGLGIAAGNLDVNAIFNWLSEHCK